MSLWCGCANHSDEYLLVNHDYQAKNTDFEVCYYQHAGRDLKFCR